MTRSDFIFRLCRAARAVDAHTDELSRIDARFGDGDHGLTMEKIAHTILVAGENPDRPQDLQLFLEHLSSAIMGLSGGSAGPLWGTLIEGLAAGAPHACDADGAHIKAMLEAALAAMRDITTADIGDKTMMDTLIPAVAAALTIPDGPECTMDAVLRAAARGASDGAKATENFIAKFGRAKSYKDQTIGTPDAGAVSLSLFFQGLAE